MNDVNVRTNSWRVNHLEMGMKPQRTERRVTHAQMERFLSASSDDSTNNSEINTAEGDDSVVRWALRFSTLACTGSPGERADSTPQPS
ncbi:hypothetical protein J6590_071501 [Homalodisca vitripennis]|nr:hypothetical protein J6590_071501 [Homalodisca vitripennis]